MGRFGQVDADLSPKIYDWLLNWRWDELQSLNTCESQRRNDFLYPKNTEVVLLNSFYLALRGLGCQAQLASGDGTPLN